MGELKNTTKLFNEHDKKKLKILIRGFEKMLECILCGKIIVQNDNPKHYSVCSKCDVNDLTDKQKKFIEMGINYITCAGTYEATLVEALELLVIDDELAGMVKRATEGIIVNEDTIGLETIKKIALNEKPGSTFLAEKHTRKHLKQELYMPIHKLINRNRRSTWRKKGSKDIMESAHEKVEEILRDYKPPELSQDIHSELQEYIKKVEERTIDDYMKAEGMTSGSVSLPGTDISIKER
ncbi:hypothetical protein ES707_15075 [subsurface metagenome]